MSELKSKIWLSSPHMGGNEMNYIREAFDTNLIAPAVNYVDAFERSLAEYSDTKHCVALSSGTSALHLALIALGVGPGDYVICQSFTFVASANPISYLGATPVFVDSEADTWNMDPKLLEKAILEINEKQNILPGSPCTLHPETCNKIKAIIPVHIYGMPAKMDEIIATGRKYDIPVIENAAEALGSRYFNKPAGSMGVMSVLSFNGNKIITTSGGGALLSNHTEFIPRVRSLSNQARDTAQNFTDDPIGYNYTMSNIVAGIGLGQLEVLKERVEKRRAINRFYRENMGNTEGIAFQTEPSSDFLSNYWLTAVTIDPAMTDGITREDIRLAMAEENIEVRPLFKPLHLQPVFEGAPAFLNGLSEHLFDNGLCLPSGSNLEMGELNRVVETFLKALKISPSRLRRAKRKAA